MPEYVKKHFKKVDPRLFAVLKDMKEHGELTPEKHEDHFVHLSKIIIGQQLSGKAARSIWKRFEALFPRNAISARSILAHTEDELRTVGMAYAKARSLRDLSEKVLTKEINLKNIEKMDERAVREELVKIKGVGPWTIEMFLMFSLGKEDVFSYGDRGLQKGMEKIYNFKKKPTEQELNRITKKWSPYRTYAALILWQLVDTK